MIYDYSKLKGRIKELFDTQMNFAKYIEIGNSTLTSRLGNKTFFDQNEIIKICYALNIEIEEIALYFFKVKVQ